MSNISANAVVDPSVAHFVRLLADRDVVVHRMGTIARSRTTGDLVFQGWGMTGKGGMTLQQVLRNVLDAGAVVAQLYDFPTN